MQFSKSAVFIKLWFDFFKIISSASLFSTSSIQDLDLDSHLYLINYNYCSHHDSVEQCLLNFQYKSHLRETGEFDVQTVHLIKARRCGNHDDQNENEVEISQSTKNIRKKRSPNHNTQYIEKSDLNGITLNLPRWSKNRLLYHVRNSPENLSLTTARQIFRRAVQIWSKYTDIKFIETKIPEIADITFSFKYRLHEDGFSNAFDGPGGALAHAFFPTRGEAHFDVEEKWVSGLDYSLSDVNNNYYNNDNNNEVFDYSNIGSRRIRSTVGRGHASLLAVASHEMGHILGLPHSPVRGSLMSPYYDDYRRNIALSFDDIQAVEYLYGKNFNYEISNDENSDNNNNNNNNPLSPTGIFKRYGPRHKNSPIKRFMNSPKNNKQPYQTKDRCIRRDIHDIDVDIETGHLRIMKNMNYYLWSPRQGYVMKRRIARTYEGMSGYLNAVVSSRLRG